MLPDRSPPPPASQNSDIRAPAEVLPPRVANGVPTFQHAMSRTFHADLRPGVTRSSARWGLLQSTPKRPREKERIMIAVDQRTSRPIPRRAPFASGTARPDARRLPERRSDVEEVL